MAMRAAAAPGRCRPMPQASTAAPGLARPHRATHVPRAPRLVTAAAAQQQQQQQHHQHHQQQHQWRLRGRLVPTAATAPSASATSATSVRHRQPLRRHLLLVSAAATTASRTLSAARPQQQLQQLRLRGGAAARPSRPRRSGVAVRVSANLFARIYRIVTAFFSGLVASVEDPEKLLERVSEEMQEDMIRMRQATAQVMASQRQLSTKQKSMQSSADQWLARAELAVRRGEDELAREALRRRKVLQEDAGPRGQLPSPTMASPSPLVGRPLRDVFDPLERELEELRRRATRD
ncbi:Membrane-associated protein, chloroplastic [Tetrabaena socialis]|uniref:Membrane-associated protein, chloroplastic n=1 Tax=Tetrabaena socialis TaxID=47790 RepID=A0A2J8AHQ5_9CHLO|nr:Membrane-associated protein, chloroplastic [Tetrabaena socialis]|eukprot:PNH12049.1 Membrane-associated protein, chloroplastic [Tetrabaena socialis]